MPRRNLLVRKSDPIEGKFWKTRGFALPRANRTGAQSIDIGHDAHESEGVFQPPTPATSASASFGPHVPGS